MGHASAREKEKLRKQLPMKQKLTNAQMQDIDLKKMNHEETKSTKEGEVLGLRSWVLGNNRPPTTSHRPPASLRGLRGEILFLKSYSIAELTDDVTELKEGRREVKVTQSFARAQFATIFEALDQAAVVARQTAINQLRYEQESNERMTRLEATVQKISDMVDRYLSARLNGGSKN